jgi:hypothetical protein
MEQDQNTVAGGWFKFGSSSKPAVLEVGCAKSHHFPVSSTKCSTMSYRDKFMLHHTQACKKSNQKDLLSDSINQKFFFPSDILVYHLKG